MRHTASFLQTFHTAATESARYAAAEADEERAALDFLATGEAKPLAPMTPPKPVADRPALRSGEYVAEFNGVQVKLGGYGMLTEAQAKFLTALMRDRDVPEKRVEATTIRLSQGMAKSAASETIHTYKQLPWKPRESAAPARMAAPATPVQGKTETPMKDGIYVDRETGRIFKLQFNKAQGDGTRLYAKRLEISFDRNGERETHSTGLLSLDLDGVKVNPDNGKPDVEMSWEYVANLIREVRADWRLTPEAAKEWGVLYGSCIRCHRPLTKEESIGRMMGDWCAGKQGF
jgi:Family of unknown function (DUF6011)